jgi:type II secretory pathway predicted ATPase ExeA
VNKNLLSLYGLKWNPFSPDAPHEALLVTSRAESFCWRIEQLARQGGFALVHGEPGTGKSVLLRILVARIQAIRDLSVGVLTRPQAKTSDFYRELGHLFGVPFSPHNRWAGAKALRERWQAHLDASLCRPVLIVDEAQEMLPSVLGELRLLVSTELDAKQALTVVLAGDARLLEKLKLPDLVPVGTRIRTRLHAEPASVDELLTYLRHALDQAGSPSLMSSEVMTALCEHAAGNLRVLMNLADELLTHAVQRQADTINEKLFFEVYGQATQGRGRKAATR